MRACLVDRVVPVSGAAKRRKGAKLIERGAGAIPFQGHVACGDVGI